MGDAGEAKEEARESPQADVQWARRVPARAVRELVLMGVLGPLMDLYTRRRVRGHEHLDGLEAPVLFVANHASHMDTPAILRALPGWWRWRTAVAAATDYFYRQRWRANAVSLLFNTVPMERNGGGLEPGATSHLTRLIEDGWSLLVFPEGSRSRDGSVGRLRSGAAVLAAEHELPMVPVLVTGTLPVMPPGRRWMRRRGTRRQPIQLLFGPPIHGTPGEDPAEMMERVRLFYEEWGAATTSATERASASTA